MNAETAVDEQREEIANRLGEPDQLQFPDGWTTSSSWRRAQAARSTIGAVNPAEFDVLLGREDDETALSRHRVLFAVYEGDLVAECDCDGYRFRGWCAHVALLWWHWSRDDLGVTDLDTGRTHLSPPWWLTVDDVEHDRVDAETSQPVAADGGVDR
ncbi:hypothetical protein SAMN04488066_101369 [Halorubrum aquaticum]|uniref:SWIM-type domain-containing protein n=1 Tax=Halorubrum aquaticum TaxID=387340 RepID=A0A1I2Z9E5_9EURY|nr:hypothetical protein [Halorubrum aquaticum]SFH34482.1 hypothetical protein SAMN04488066_101369 [Halorubrum aquaticum]